MNVPSRVIVVEDDYLLSETLTDSLAVLGYQVAAQASDLLQGLHNAETVPCEFAIIDLYLKGESALPILDKLHDLGIPFLVATGAYVEDIPARHLLAPRLSKPYDLHELRQAIQDLPLDGPARNPA